MKISHPLFYHLVGFVGSLWIKALNCTCRVDYRALDRVNEIHQKGEKVIYSFWHGKMLVPAYTHRKQNVRILISPHRDGEYIAQVVRRLGFKPVRGSTNRGATAALRELMEDASSDIAFTIDGPRGPLQKVTTRGILKVAQHHGWPILPGGISISRKWKLKSWDQFEIPKPFSTFYLRAGEPLYVPKDAEDLEPFQSELQRRMSLITQETDALVGESTGV